MRNDRQFDVRETVARAYRGRDPAHAESFLRWLNFNGYTIVEIGTGEATLAPKLGEDGAAPQDTTS
jgi:hypothetical protein